MTPTGLETGPKDRSCDHCTDPLPPLRVGCLFNLSDLLQVTSGDVNIVSILPPRCRAGQTCPTVRASWPLPPPRPAPPGPSSVSPGTSPCRELPRSE